MTAPSTYYVAHLAMDGDPLSTYCGEPWQGWQAPSELHLSRYAGDPRARLVPPSDQPRPHQDAVRQCQACRRA